MTGGKFFLLVVGLLFIPLGAAFTYLGPEYGRQAIRNVPESERGGVQSEWYWTFQGILVGAGAMLIGVACVVIAFVM